MRATARILAAATGGTTTLPVLDGDGPFELRRLRSHGLQARVCVVGAMTAPLGGDRLRIEATAPQGAALHLTSAAATLALRGPPPEHATYDVHLTVGEHAQLHWLPKPLICAAGSELRQSWTIGRAPTARLVLREDQILGRTGEPSGRVTTRLTVRSGGRTLLDQQAAYGPGAPGWVGPAVLAGNRATGQLLLVDPHFKEHPRSPPVRRHLGRLRRLLGRHRPPPRGPLERARRRLAAAGRALSTAGRSPRWRGRTQRALPWTDQR
ncbi:urease accessory protein UreD [Streptomyces sp. NPDC058773]|uniref:urease accessory protein UreD n=1 Tax=Streptomyces sp. NPDC058773 TaxID=3346632 RepID=UPI00368AD233